MMAKVCILDYGSGNVKSVWNAFSQFSNAQVSNLEQDIIEATHLVLPGVGSYAAAIRSMNEVIPIELLKRELKHGKPFLGICVGMQVLSTVGHEFEECKGIDLISGTVSQIQTTGEPLPHIGWNNLENITASPILSNVTQDDDFYFVHSFAFKPKDQSHVLATTTYSEMFPAVVGKGNIFGVQFHPEKSQQSGKKIINNFLEMS